MKKIVFVLCVLSSGCAGVRRPPVVDSSIAVSSQYNFRGVPQNDRGVLQPEVGVRVAATPRTDLGFVAWGNIDMDDDTGAAVLPDGNGGRFSEIDFTGSVFRRVADMDMALGIISYNFPNGVGGSTSELYAGLTWSVLGFEPALTVWYDFDAVDGVYVNGGVSRSKSITESLGLNIGASVGFTDRDHAAVYYGQRTAGIADLAAAASVSYLYHDIMTVSLSCAGSTLLKNELSSSVEDQGIDSDNLWVILNLGWSF